MDAGELTISHQLKKIQSLMPNAEAFVSYNESTGRDALTYSEFYKLCCRFSHILKEHGVKSGDHVAITLPVSLESAVATFGIVLAGAIPSTLDITFTHGEALMQCLEKLKSRIIIVRDEQYDNVLNYFKPAMTFSNKAKDAASLSWSRLPLMTQVFLVRRGGDNDFLTKLRACKEEYVCPSISPDKGGFIHFTTGTVTDYIKLTEMTHEGVIRHNDIIYKQIFRKPYPKFLYMNGWYWKTCLPYDVLHGVTRCMPDEWTHCKDFAKLLYRIIRSEGLRLIDLQPLYLDQVLDLWKADQPNGEPLVECMNVMGMPITRKLLTRLRPLAQRINLLYGSHEAGIVNAHTIEAADVDRFIDFDCGPVVPGVQSIIVDENWKQVPPGVKGRVLVKSPGMFSGFPSEPERYARCFDKDGWFITNDLAYYDKKTNHLMPGGRLDSIILHGEYMIYPVWLEDMLKPLPAIEQIIAVPILETILFHCIGFCVIKKPGMTQTKAEMTKELSKHLYPMKVPLFDAKYLIFFDKFPTRADGSVDRSQMFDIVGDMIHNKKDMSRIVTD